MQKCASGFTLRPSPALRPRLARVVRARRFRRRLVPRANVARIVPRFVKDARFRVRTSLDDVPPTAATAQGQVLSVSLSNEDHPDYTVITVQGKSKSGLLNSITSLFCDLGLEVMKAEVGSADGEVLDKFFIVDDVTGEKLTDEKDTENVKKCIETLLTTRGKTTGGGTRPDFRKQPEKTNETLYTLMGNDTIPVES